MHIGECVRLALGAVGVRHLKNGSTILSRPTEQEAPLPPLRLDDAHTNDSDGFLKHDDVCWQFANRIQSRSLATLRDTLLPKLLRGELSMATKP